MKRVLKNGLFLSLLSTQVMAVNPVTGWYGGFMVTASYTPSFELTAANPNAIYIPPIPSLNLPVNIPSSEIDYRAAGGGAGGQLGYRFNPCWRLEGEFLFNVNEYSSISFGNRLTINRYSDSQPNGLNQNGRTNLYVGMINAYYDFVSSDPESYLVPYVGIGLGYAQVENRITFNAFEQEIGPRIDLSTSGFAGQIILGFSYFLDDFTTANLDYRFLTTNNLSNENVLYSYDRRFEYQTLNFSMNFAFDKAV